MDLDRIIYSLNSDSNTELITEEVIAQLNNIDQNQLLNDENFSDAVYKRLNREDSGQENDSICMWMFDYFARDNPFCKIVIYKFVPILVWTYLSRYSHGKYIPGIEAVLIGIYHYEVQKRGGKELTWNPPTIAWKRSSDPKSRRNTAMSLTENSLKQLDKQSNSKKEFLEQSLPIIEPQFHLAFHERQLIVRICLEFFNQNLIKFPLSTQFYFCEVVQMICLAGFPFQKDEYEKLSRFKPIVKEEKSKEFSLETFLRTSEYGPRISLSNETFQSLINGISWCLFNAPTEAKAQKAFACLQLRANYELIPEIMLSLNALSHLQQFERFEENAEEHI